MHRTYHKSWYFITQPICASILPDTIRSLTSLCVTHFAPAHKHSAQNILIGHCTFKRPKTHHALKLKTDYIIQWIPKSWAQDIQAVTQVDFSSWEKEDFDIQKFLSLPYPWEAVSVLCRAFKMFWVPPTTGLRFHVSYTPIPSDQSQRDILRRASNTVPLQQPPLTSPTIQTVMIGHPTSTHRARMLSLYL